MQSENNGLNLFDQEQEHKRDIKSAFAITGLIALGAAAAIGVGFVLGGRGGDGRESGVASTSATATRTRPVSPTAATGTGPQGAVQGAQVGGQPGGGGNTGGSQTGSNAAGNPGGGNAGGGAPSSNAGDTSGGGGEPDVPATTATAVPPTATNTAVPATSTATSTPVPPTNTPTATATATATATPGFEICIPCLDPGIIIHIDFVAPSFVSTYRADCPGGTWVTFDVDETADLWVTYTVLGLPFESAHVNGTHFEESISGPFFYANDVVFHATDAWGNASTYEPGPGFCF